MYSILGNVKGEINKDQVYLIKKALTKIKNIVKNVLEDIRFKIEENGKIIDIVEIILELNNENQLGEGLKTPDQMLSRLPITLAQSNAWNNLQNLTKQLYKSLVDIIKIWRQSLWELKIAKLMSLTDLDYH